MRHLFYQHETRYYPSKIFGNAAVLTEMKLAHFCLKLECDKLLMEVMVQTSFNLILVDPNSRVVYECMQV